jgi:hypothetical protein
MDREVLCTESVRFTGDTKRARANSISIPIARIAQPIVWLVLAEREHLVGNPILWIYRLIRFLAQELS